MTAREIFYDTEGRLRSGFAIAVFVAAAFAAQLLLATLVIAANLPRGVGRTYDTPGFATQSFLFLASSLMATFAGCAAVRQPLGAVGLSDAHAVQRAAFGFALGAVFVAVVVAIPWANGKLGLARSGEPASALVAAGVRQLLILAPQSASEEILVRGFVLQQLKRGLGRAAAVLVTAAGFALLHWWNPNVSRVALVNIALVGIWLGILVLRTGSLWLAIGVHTAWNFCEGFVWGQPVSGLEPGIALLRRAFADTGPWTGGGFGPEASTVTSAALVVAIIVSLAVPRRTKVI